MTINQTKYWDDFYSQEVNLEPSSFALWLKTFINLKNVQLFDWGCGNGRDGLFLSEFAKKVVMLDSSSKAILFIKNEIDKKRITNATAQVFDVNNSYDYNGSDKGKILHYARFFLHAIDDVELINFFNYLTEFSSKRGCSFAVFEYRVKEDSENLYFVYGNHSRWLRAPDIIVKHMLDRGWELKFEEIGKGLAVFKDENPLVARQVFEYSIT